MNQNIFIRYRNLLFAGLRKVNLPHWKLVLCIGCIATTLPSYAQTPVKIESIADIEISLKPSIPATVLSLREVDIASQITAIVEHLPIEIGQTVVENQIIAELDCTDNRLTLEQSKAQLGALLATLKLTQQQLDRLNQLKQTNNASEEQINQKQADLSSTKSRINAQNIAIKINQNQVGKCTIRAPFKGVVTTKNITIGDFVTAGKVITRIVDIDNVELETNISHDDLKQIQTSKQLTYSQHEQSFSVSVRTLLPVIDDVTQSQLMRLTFNHTKPLPGSSGRLSWKLSGKTLPPALLVSRDGFGIFIAEQQDDKQVARFVPIDDARQGQPIHVNLPENTLIIVDGQFGLSDGEVIVTQ